MILIVLVISAIAFFLCFMFTFKPAVRILSVLITGIFLVGSTALMTLNYHDHFGMRKVTTTETRTIYSASNSDTLPLALYQPVGTSGKNNVYIYNTQEKQKTPKHTQANEYTTNKIKWTNSSTAKLVTKETRWQFKNSFYKNLYMWSGMGNTLDKRVNTFEYPKTYVKITTKQAEKLKKQMGSASAQAEMKTQATAYVEAQVAAAKAKNPSMSATEQAALVQKATTEYQSKALKQVVSQLK